MVVAADLVVQMVLNLFEKVGVVDLLEVELMVAVVVAVVRMGLFVPVTIKIEIELVKGIVDPLFLVKDS